MTLRGEARRALSLAYSASFFGGIFSVVALVLMAPVLASIAPMFGSREIFLAALLGIILVIIAHRGQTLIAAALACLGIFLNTIGLEAIKYTKRYTFDQSWLAGGVDLIVVGSHGRHGFALLLGSTSTGVLRGAQCDVLAVRVGKKGEKSDE